MTAADRDAEFVLGYSGLQIGALRLHSGWWEFQYTDAFREQHDVDPLVDFPDASRTYRSQTLWPFFMARIPSLAQPQVREVIAREEIDEHSDVDLLRRFGQRTISNPFILEETQGTLSTREARDRTRGPAPE